MKLATIIYPGEMWGKRLAHLVSISAIGFTLFLSHVQSDLISRSDKLFQQGSETGTGTPTEINTEAREASGTLRKAANIILFITGLLMIRIIYAIFWIFLDMKRGNAARKMKKLVWIAMIANVVILLACTIIYYFVLDQVQPLAQGETGTEPKPPATEVDR